MGLNNAGRPRPSATALPEAAETTGDGVSIPPPTPPRSHDCFELEESPAKLGTRPETWDGVGGGGRAPYPSQPLWLKHP